MQTCAKSKGREDVVEAMGGESVRNHVESPKVEEVQGISKHRKSDISCI